MIMFILKKLMLLLSFGSAISLHAEPTREEQIQSFLCDAGVGVGLLTSGAASGFAGNAAYDKGAKVIESCLALAKAEKTRLRALKTFTLRATAGSALFGISVPLLVYGMFGLAGGTLVLFQSATRRL